MNGCKCKACDHYNKSLIKKSIKVIIENAPKGKLFKNCRDKRYGIKHEGNREPVNFVTFIQINIGTKKTNVYLRDKNVYNRRKDDRSSNYRKERKPAEIIKAKNRFERFKIYFNKVNRDRRKKNFYPE